MNFFVSLAIVIATFLFGFFAGSYWGNKKATDNFNRILLTLADQLKKAFIELPNSQQ